MPNHLAAWRLMDRAVVGLTLCVRTVALEETNHPGSVGHLLIADRRLFVPIASSRQGFEYGGVRRLSRQGRARPGDRSFCSSIFRHLNPPAYATTLIRQRPHRGNTGLRLVEMPVASCKVKCDCSAIAISDLPPCGLSSGPNVMTRSCVRSRLALRKLPVALTVARASVHVGVRSPLVMTSKEISCDRTFLSPLLVFWSL